MRVAVMVSHGHPSASGRGRWDLPLGEAGGLVQKVFLERPPQRRQWSKAEARSIRKRKNEWCIWIIGDFFLSSFLYCILCCSDVWLSHLCLAIECENGQLTIKWVNIPWTGLTFSFIVLWMSIYCYRNVLCFSEPLKFAPEWTAFTSSFPLNYLSRPMKQRDPNLQRLRGTPEDRNSSGRGDWFSVAWGRPVLNLIWPLQRTMIPQLPCAYPSNKGWSNLLVFSLLQTLFFSLPVEHAVPWKQLREACLLGLPPASNLSINFLAWILQCRRALEKVVTSVFYMCGLFSEESSQGSHAEESSVSTIIAVSSMMCWRTWVLSL